MFHAVIACRCDSQSVSAAGLVYLDRREQTRWTTGFARKDYVTGACDSWRFQAFFFLFSPLTGPGPVANHVLQKIRIGVENVPRLS